MCPVFLDHLTSPNGDEAKKLLPQLESEVKLELAKRRKTGTETIQALEKEKKAINEATDDVKIPDAT